MLTEMRALSQNWIGRSIMAVVLGFIILSFAVWGIGDRFNHFNASELATVGGARITVDEYREAYRNQLQQLQQKQKRAITNEEARQQGIDRQVLARLLTDHVLDQEAVRLGLAVGDGTIAESIRKDDVFKGANGQFDKARFLSLMRDNGYTEASYVRQQRGLILRQDVGDAIIGDLHVPKAIENDIHRYQAEVRDVDFFVLPASAAGKVPTPSDADLKTFYEQRASQFQAPEYRKLLVLSIVPANLVKPDAVTNEDVKKRYDQMKQARFVVPEKRTVEQLVFPDAKAADAAKAKLDGGTSFDTLVTDEKKKPADVGLGTVAKDELADPAVATAAFALPEGGTSTPVKGQFGTVLVHVKKILAGHEQPLMEVSAQLKDEMAIIRARSQATKMRDAIEEQRLSGKTLTEAAKSVGLTPQTIDAIDKQGRDRTRKPIEGLVEGPTLLKNAFGTEVGADTEMIQAPNGGDVWFEVASIEPSHQLPLAAVKPAVEAQWRNAEVAKRLDAEADKLAKAIDGGKTLDAAAAENGKLQVYHATNVTRQGAPGIASNAALAAFDVAVGKAGATSVPGPSQLVFKVKSAKVPPIDPKDKEFSKLMEQVQIGLANDALAEYLVVVQREIGVKINQQALQSALGTDAGS